MEYSNKSVNVEERSKNNPDLKGSDQQGPILLFDGVCNLCNASVQWVLLHDKKAVFKFAALQSEFAQAILSKHQLNTKDFDTVVLVDGDRIWLRSDAALEICDRLGGVWAYVALLRFKPRFIRDFFYNLIAKNRYRFWGRRETCMLPRPEWQHRFLS